jgi:hypothetical protein
MQIPTAAARDGIDRAADTGAGVAFPPAITLLRYPADVAAGPNPGAQAEPLLEGPTFELAADAARADDVFVHASLYEQAPADDGLRFADLDLDQRHEWLELFPFLMTRRPDSYAALTDPLDAQLPYGAGHAATAVVK